MQWWVSMLPFFMTGKGTTRTAKTIVILHCSVYLARCLLIYCCCEITALLKQLLSLEQAGLMPGKLTTNHIIALWIDDMSCERGCLQPKSISWSHLMQCIMRNFFISCNSMEFLQGLMFYWLAFFEVYVGLCPASCLWTKELGRTMFLVQRFSTLSWVL